MAAVEVGAIRWVTVAAVLWSAQPVRPPQHARLQAVGGGPTATRAPGAARVATPDSGPFTGTYSPPPP